MIEEDILKDFLVEAKDSILKIEAGFMELEKEKGNTEIFKSLIRTLHSLKETAYFYGFKSLEGVAHFAEDILLKLKDGLLEPTEETVAILLKCLYQIKYIVGFIEENKVEPHEDRFLEFLRDLSNFNERLKDINEVQIGPKETGETISPESEVLPESSTASDLPKIPGETQTGDTYSLETSASLRSSLDKPRAEEEKVFVPSPSKEITEPYIEVDVKLLDNLMNLAGELVLARNRVVQLAKKLNDPDLLRSVQALSMVTTKLQETIMKTRRQSIGVVFNQFTSMVRELSKSLNKRVNLHLEGTETELDRFVIEALKEPLTHLVRNSIDYGIENPDYRVQVGKPPEGNLILKAYHEGGQVVIELEDDGKGEEKVNQVLSGGPSLDVVKTDIEKLGGSVEINTISGKGTIVRIKIPFTSAIIPALIVTSDENRYAIPQVNLKEIVSINPEKDILYVGDNQFYRLRGEIIPIISLSQVLGKNKGEDEKNLLILTMGEKFYGLLVGKIYDFEEIVVKPLGKWFKGIPLYSGATIMGDGKLALILDVVGLYKYAGLETEKIKKILEEQNLKTSREESQLILLFEIGDTIFALPLALVVGLDKIKAEEIKFVNSREIIIYKDKVTPLLRLENYLPIQGVRPQDEYSLLFFTERNKTYAILCSRIVDIIETTLQLKRELYVQPGILGYKIINEKTVFFIDIYKIIEMHNRDWFSVKHKADDGVSISNLSVKDFTLLPAVVDQTLLKTDFT